MKKVKCSKYPKEKCKYCEDKTFEKCEFCMYNLYHDLESFKITQDYFKKVNEHNKYSKPLD